jgi:ATP-binding protein involved in chromosome partitioning
VPLSVPLREGGDSGVPVVLGAPDDPAARALVAVADRVTSMGRGLAGRKLGLSLS